MSLPPRIILAGGSVLLIAVVNITGVTQGPADIHVPLLLCAGLAILTAMQSAALERTDLTLALLLSLPPVIALASSKSPTWLIPFLAALLLVAGELNALSWECDGVGPTDSALQRRLQHILQLGLLGAAAALTVLVASAGPSPRGMVAILIAAAALVALGSMMFRRSRPEHGGRSRIA